VFSFLFLRKTLSFSLLTKSVPSLKKKSLKTLFLSQIIYADQLQASFIFQVIFFSQMSLFILFSSSLFLICCYYYSINLVLCFSLVYLLFHCNHALLVVISQVFHCNQKLPCSVNFTVTKSSHAL
jgi:hypothetical protein